MSSQTTQQALPTGNWTVDTVHSTVGFAVPYLAGTFQGTFSDFGARLSDGVLRGTAEVGSIQVKDANLEAHLQSPTAARHQPPPQRRHDHRNSSPCSSTSSPAARSNVVLCELRRAGRGARPRAARPSRPPRRSDPGGSPARLGSSVLLGELEIAEVAA